MLASIRSCKKRVAFLFPMSGILFQNGLKSGNTTLDFGSIEFFPFSSEESHSSASFKLSLALNVQVTEMFAAGGIGSPLKRRNCRLSTFGLL